MEGADVAEVAEPVVLGVEHAVVPRAGRGEGDERKCERNEPREGDDGGDGAHRRTTSSVCSTRTPPSMGCRTGRRSYGGSMSRCRARDGQRTGLGSHRARGGVRPRRCAERAHVGHLVLALGRPLVAVDLPGHGHSGWRTTAATPRENMADDVAVAVEGLAPAAEVGRRHVARRDDVDALAPRSPDLVRSLVLVDITPGVNRREGKAIIDFIDGPQTFASFDELLDRTKEHNPTRSESSLRRGILHNAHQLDDGTWQWNYDRRATPRPDDGAPTGPTTMIRLARRRCGTTVAAIAVRCSSCGAALAGGRRRRRRRAPPRQPAPTWRWSTAPATASRVTDRWSWPR